MDMDFTSLGALVTALVGTGGIVSFFYLRQTREAKDLSNAKKVVLEYEKLLERYKKRDAEQQARIEEMEKKYQEKVEEIESNYQSKISELEQTIEDLKSQVNDLNAKHDEDLAFRCEKKGCIGRKPRPQNYKPVENNKRPKPIKKGVENETD